MSAPVPPPPVPVDASAGVARAEPRGLEAGAGVSWITEGWQIFVAAPGVWIAITLIWALIMIGLGFVPLLGMVAQQILAPVFVGGVMLGCQALSRGEPLSLSHLFDGFKAPQMSPLMVFGLINLGISIAVVVLFALLFVMVVGANAFQELLAGDPIQMGAAALMRIGLAGMIALPVALVVVALLVMLWWFTPPLIALNGFAPVEAMKSSFRGSVVNMLPFLLYGLVMLALAFIATLPMMLGWLVLAPVSIGSVYASWRQVFAEDMKDER